MGQGADSTLRIVHPGDNVRTYHCLSIMIMIMKEKIKLIKNVQRRATKQVQTFPDIPYKERLKATILPTLQYRRYRGDMIEVYKISHGFYDENITNDFLEFCPNDREYYFRGHCFNLPKESYKKELRKVSFRCRVSRPVEQPSRIRCKSHKHKHVQKSSRQASRTPRDYVRSRRRYTFTNILP